MLEFLQNMDQPLIAVGFAIAVISGGLFFATWSDEQYKAMRYCLVGFGFGLWIVAEVAQHDRPRRIGEPQREIVEAGEVGTHGAPD